jgi:small nuclear ribonucleoprotein
MVERPLDLLNGSKGKEVIIKLKNDKQISGILLAFDININLVLDNARIVESDMLKEKLGLMFIRGDNVVYISPSS